MEFGSPVRLTAGNSQQLILVGSEGSERLPGKFLFIHLTRELPGIAAQRDSLPQCRAFGFGACNQVEAAKTATIMGRIFMGRPPVEPVETFAVQPYDPIIVSVSR